MNIYKGARYSFIMLGVVVVTLCQTATAASHCKTYNLNPDNISVATPGATFSIKNKGPNPVKIVYNDEKNIVMSIDSGKGTFFAGNVSFNYYVILANKNDTTTIELC